MDLGFRVQGSGFGCLADKLKARLQGVEFRACGLQPR